MSITLTNKQYLINEGGTTYQKDNRYTFTNRNANTRFIHYFTEGSIVTTSAIRPYGRFSMWGVGGRDDLGLSQETQDKARKIFGIPANQFFTHLGDIGYLNNEQYSYPFFKYINDDRTEMEITGGVRFEDWSMSVDDDIPFIIDEYSAAYFTTEKVLGSTIKYPLLDDSVFYYAKPNEWVLTPGGAPTVYIANTLTEYNKEIATAGADNAVFQPIFHNMSSAYPSTLKPFIEWLLSDVETYEELSEKFYQTPVRTKIGYNINCNIKTGSITGNTTITQALKGSSEYEDSAQTGVYTEYNGITLDKPSVGITGTGTSYDVILSAYLDDKKSNEIIVATIDEPVYPVTQNIKGTNIDSLLKGVKGLYKVSLNVRSYKTEYSLSLVGNQLRQNKTRTLNVDTTSINNVYFSLQEPYYLTDIENNDKNLTNSGTYFKETLAIVFEGIKKPTTSLIPDTPLPNFSSFTNVYKLSPVDVIGFNAWLWGSETGLNLDELKKIVQNPLDNIIFLKACPFDVEATNNSTINIGNIAYSETTYPVVASYSKQTIGTIFLTRLYDDWRDYPPFTKHRMYLPFVGFVDLPVSLMYNETCTLYCTINTDTFQTLFELKRNNDNMILGQWECNSGIDFPLTSNNVSRQLASFVSASFKTMSNVTSAMNKQSNDVVGSVMGMVTSALDSNVETRGTASSNMSVACARWCYVEVTYMIDDTPTTYGHVNGYPCNQTLSLSGLIGYTECDNIDLTGFECTEQEKNLLKNMLTTGIFL